MSDLNLSSEPELYADLVYKLKKMVDTDNFNYFKKIGYYIIVLRQTACVMVNPITVRNVAFLFNCAQAGHTLDSMMVITYNVNTSL